MQKIEAWVGAFLIAGIITLFILTFRISGLSGYTTKPGYFLSVMFDNIGSLKRQAPVSMAGVRIGQVTAIKLDETHFKALVTLRIGADYHRLPKDTSARILTQGLLGASYIDLRPGFSSTFLKNGDSIEDSRPALVLEDLIEQFAFSKN